MDKKKAVKLATASAVAASAFVAANPNASEAATNVATVVSQAKAQFKKAYYTYSHTVTETGEFPNINDVYAEYNKAKKAYADAVALVNKAGGAKKDAYLADLQKEYETYVFKANPKSGEARVATYIDAYNYAVKLDGLRQQLADAVQAKDLAKAEELYHKISYELKSRTVILDRVYGQSTRDLLRTKFKAEAQKLRDSLIYDITVAMKAREVQDAVKAGNLDKAKAAVDKINEYLPKVTDAFKAQLTDEAKKAVDAYEAALAPKVESVSAINPNTVEVKGTGLDKLTAENFSLEGNKVTSYNVNAETGVATLTFEKKFESGKEQTLKLTEKVEGQEDKVSEFKFTYNLEIKSVVANALTVDNDTAGQKLTFKINGEDTDADVDYIKASGYNVEFQATSAVFTGSASSSTTGELAGSLTPDTKFAYKVVITDKDGNVVAESPLAEVKVVDKSNVVTAIDSFDLTDGTIKLSSNTVVLGESFRIANVVGDKDDGTKDTDITSLVEFTSSNKDVALVDSTGNILPIKPGSTTITIKAGNVSKSFVLTVASEARVAKTATLTTSSLKLVENGSNASVGVVVKDQYGDVVSGLNLANATYEITQVNVNGAPTNVVNVTGTTTDAEGKASLTVTPNVAGTGTVKVKVGNNVIATFNVSVSKDTTVATRKLELVDASKDAKLDIYTGEVTDNSVDFVYNKYNAEGYLLGKETTDIGTSGTKYTVSVEEPNGKDIIDVAVNAGVITVTAKADTGTAYLVIKEGSVVREKLPITVVNSTPTVSAITLKSAEKVTTATTIKADSVLTLKDDLGSGKDKAVQNITLTTASSKAVRLDETTGKLYLDADNDGSLDVDGSGNPTELVVGTVAITENISGSATGTTIATVAGDKGSVVYTVKDASGKVIATSVIDVEVPSN
jgi:SbsC C-terminal domain/Bacterial Ig-like domain (group 2)